MVFDGSELLPFAIKNIRPHVDFISVVYQTTSYFGNPADSELLSNIKKVEGLADTLSHYESDLKLHHKTNELNIRNFGLKLSREAGCTHHISADVDEFYKGDQLENAKKVMEGDYNYSLATCASYYKEPTFLIYPPQNQMMTFIHPVTNDYIYNKTFPFRIEITRRLVQDDKPFVFKPEEMTIHHMSYVRKDMKRKLMNSDNGRFYKRLDEFVEDFNKYQLGDKLCIVPDFRNRKTKLVDNIFGIKFNDSI